MTDVTQISTEIREQLKTRADTQGVSVNELLRQLLDTSNSSSTEALKNSEEKYRTLFDLATDAILTILQPNGDIMDVNTAAENLLGYSKAELKTMNGSDLLVPGTFDGMQKTWEEQVAEHGSSRLEAVWVHKDGSHVPVSVSSRPIEINGQSFIQLIGHDISQRLETEQALHESESRLQLAFESTNEGLWDQDIIANKTYLSPRYFTILGYEPYEFKLTFEQWQSMIHPDDLPDLLKSMKQQPPRLYNIHEYRMQHKSGHYIWVLDRSRTAERDEDGKATRIIGTITDITSRKQTELALKESESRYRTIASNLPDTVIVLYDEDIRYTLVDGQGLAQIGLNKEEIEGKRLRDVLPPEVYEPNEPAVQAALQGEITETVIQFKRQYFRIQILPVRDDKDMIIGGMVVSHNITNLKHIEHQLKETVNQLELAITTAQLGIWHMDIATGDIVWNDVLCNIYGVSPESTSRNIDDWEKYLHPDDLTYATDQFRVLTDGKSVYDVQYRIVRPDGGVRHINASGTVIRDDNGEIVKLFGVNHDMTEYERTKRHLAESESRYHTLFNGSLYPISVFNEYGQIVMLNDIAARSMQTTPEMAIGKHVRDFFPDFHERTMNRIQQVLEKQDILFVEDYIELHDGGHWFWTVVQPVPNESNQLRQVQYISYDITDQKRWEEARQLSEQRYKATIEASLDGVYLMESVRDESNEIIDFRIVEINEKSVVQLNMPREKLVGSLICEMYPIQRELGLFDLYKQVVETGNPVEREFPVDRINSAAAWFFQQVVKVDDGVAIMNRDITDQKYSEQLTIDHERMKAQFNKEREHNLLIQRIISALSHDLRTPLTVIATSRELLSKYYDRLTEEKRLKRLDMIDHQIQYALNLLDDTVAMARGDLDERQFKPSPIQLATLCQVSINELNSVIDGSHQLVFINKGKVEMADIDETLVNRILLNLLSNAIKYSPQGSHIRLELDRHVSWVVLRVIDNGIGIRGDDLDSIFDPFFRTREAQSFDGTGLGLSIVKDCVDRHHGIIRVESEMGRGTTFTIKLPSNIQP